MRGIRRIQIRKAFVLYIKYNTSLDKRWKLFWLLQPLILEINVKIIRRNKND